MVKKLVGFALRNANALSDLVTNYRFSFGAFVTSKISPPKDF